MKALYQTTGEVVQFIACFVKNHEYLTTAQATGYNVHQDFTTNQYEDMPPNIFLFFLKEL